LGAAVIVIEGQLLLGRVGNAELARYGGALPIRRTNFAFCPSRRISRAFILHPDRVLHDGKDLGQRPPRTIQFGKRALYAALVVFANATSELIVQA
jgi:hypothetical protein